MCINRMASKLSEIDDLVHNTFQGLWKLKDSVKVKVGAENFKTTKYGAEFDQMQETKVIRFIYEIYIYS